METNIEFLKALEADLMDLASRDHHPKARARRGLPRVTGRVLLAAGLACVLSGAGAAGVTVYLMGSASSQPHSPAFESGIPQPPFGVDPYGHAGASVTLTQATDAFDSASPTTGGLRVPDSADANPGTITHVWIGPAAVQDGPATATGVVMEFSSGIRVDANPAQHGSPTAPTAIQALLQADAASRGPLCSVETVAGVPAEVCEGDGSPVTFDNGQATQTVDGTTVRLYLDGVFYDVFAGTTVNSAGVLGAAQSLQSVTTSGPTAP